MENKDKKATFISVTELAKLLGVSRVAVLKRIQKGDIEAERVGRQYAIRAEHVRELVGSARGEALTERERREIDRAVEKVVREYGETLKLLGGE